VDDDWLAANDLLPQTGSATGPTLPEIEGRGSKDPFAGAKVKALRLKPVMTVLSDSPCEAAVEIMREKGFDQLPVLAPTGRRLVGLVTLGNILSWLARGRANGWSPVSEVMFDFSKLSEVVTDPRDLTRMAAEPIPGASRSVGLHKTRVKGRKFIEITLDTPLSALNRFFEWNSAAVVTEKDEQGIMKPVAIATKVDLLTWLLRQK
jgi:cystathionine beta-synthase